jgi:Zn-dependent M16 (insulinase) family peptidase
VFASAAAPAPAAAVAAADIPKAAHGFTLQRQQFVREYDSHVCLYRHDKTGAELISVVNSDENKTFGAVFRTPVGDSTGIPHILVRFV